MATVSIFLCLSYILNAVGIYIACSVNETAVIRWNYGDPELGSCKETVDGGSHFRYWVQNGPDADRCARFIGKTTSVWS